MIAVREMSTDRFKFLANLYQCFARILARLKLTAALIFWQFARIET
jgi:hypothetical protein